LIIIHQFNFVIEQNIEQCYIICMFIIQFHKLWILFKVLLHWDYFPHKLWAVYINNIIIYNKQYKGQAKIIKRKLKVYF
jgi:hypothetical protein